MGIQWPLLLFAVFGGMGMGLLVYVALQIIRGCKTSLGIAGLVAAAALLAVGGAFSALHMGHPERSFYVLTNFASGISQELVATAIAMAGVAFAYEPSYSRSVERVLFGDLAPAFWAGTVVVGIAAPVAAVFFTRKASPASARALAVAALIGVFVGSVAVRVVMYSLGTSVQSFIY